MFACLGMPRLKHGAPPPHCCSAALHCSRDRSTRPFLARRPGGEGEGGGGGGGGGGAAGLKAATPLWGAGLLFDWLLPAHFPVVAGVVEAWAEAPEVTTAVLKFMAEFVLNKTQRLTFDSSSPNGILLFREVSKARPLPPPQGEP